VPALAGLMLPGCAGSHSTLDPAGPSAQAIATLWWIMLGGATAIFIATSAAVVAAWVRPQIFGARAPRLLILWGGLILPGVILVALVLSAFALGERLIARPGSDMLAIAAEGRQWQWTFRYPQTDGHETVDVLHIPAGREVEIAVTSTDVIHGFWVPQLGGKIDAVPGHVTRIRLRADRPGSYGGLCAEFCGVGHGVMAFTVIAHAPDDYDALFVRLAAGDLR